MTNKDNNFKYCLMFIACAVIGGAIFFGCNSYAGNKTAKNAEIAQKVAETPVQEPKDTTPKTEPVKPAPPIEVPKDKLEVEAGANYSIVINKSKFTLELFKDDKLLHTFPIATGKNTGDKQRVGDNRTPDGDFYVEEICDASYWTHDFGDGKGEIAGAYGPWFLSLETPGWSGIGIHGTHDPASIGTRASEGCVRMYNEDLRILKKFVKVGTKVVIKEN